MVQKEGGRMINMLKAEWRKVKRTLLRELLISIPIVFSFLAFWQLTKVSLGSDAIKKAFLIRGLFFKFFFPMLVSFISSYLVGIPSSI